MSRALALDLGERRIGVALSDPGGVIAQPLEVLERRGAEADLDRIVEMVRAREAALIVVGYPLTLRGEAGPAAAGAERFIERLRAALRRAGMEVEVVAADERLTTAAAERALLEGGLRRGRRRRVRDAVAAALLLQVYLDRARARSL